MRPRRPSKSGERTRYAGNTFNEYWAVGVEGYVGNGGRDRADLMEIDPTLYELISRLIPEDRYLPVRANVANRTREEMNRLVQTRNPEWWPCDQERERERLAARGRRRRTCWRWPWRRRGGQAALPTCTPASR